MSSKGTLPQQEVEQSQWNATFSAITREYRGSHAKLEVFGPGVDYQVETAGRPFVGIAADIKDNERTVWVDFGEVRHGIHGAKVVRFVQHVGRMGPVIEVEGEDETKTLLTLGAPEEYELPPGE
jgi:Family of unknown function (DUF5335)